MTITMNGQSFICRPGMQRSGGPAFRRLVMSNTIFAIDCNGGCGIVMMSWLGRQVAQKIFGSAVQPEATQ